MIDQTAVNEMWKMGLNVDIATWFDQNKLTKLYQSTQKQWRLTNSQYYYYYYYWVQKKKCKKEYVLFLILFERRKIYFVFLHHIISTVKGK